MIRIFETGDNHIGLKYASHEKASVLAEKRVTAFEGMVERANAEQCALFVITGDLFENTYGVSRREVSALLDILSAFHGTAAILPGNHDYYDKEAKLWQYFADAVREKDNILLLNMYRPYPLTANGEDVVLYPAFCTSLHSGPGENNLDWIKKEAIVPDRTYRIGIAHGAVEGETRDNEGEYFLMSRSELEAIPVDLWLIGHTHIPFPREVSEAFTAAGRIFNAGTHVQTDVNCRTEGQCFIIDLLEDKTVRARKVISGNVSFCRRTITLSAGKMEADLTRELSGIAPHSVVELILSGAVSKEEYENRFAILEPLLSRFIEAACQDTHLSKLISKDLIEAEFPETSFSAGLLTALLDEPKEAQLAYELLKSLKREHST